MPRWHRRACFLAFALIGLPAVVTGGYAAAGSGIDVRLTPSRSTPGGQVTLVTGDVVRMHRTDGGRYVASIEPGPGRHDVTFHTHEVDDELRVIPQDAVPYVSAGLLDTDLFEVSRLLSEGYGGRSTLPLIVQYGAPGADGLRGAGVRRTRDLTSINGASMSVRRDALGELWKELTRGRDQATVARPSFAAGVSRIWLDGRVHATLEESTAQIGAPRAWETGLDGAGVDVAVLDTGVDFDHPDFEGRIELARDFTGGGTVQDGHGHGSHVAGIVLGSGVASEPRRRGVAPAADLMVGKVLTDKGSGAESWIIDGMEWAAQSGAEVVNMSLGGPGGDGTDPMSVALDTLTAETGALFVVAAGNDGQDMSIGAPGVAGAALTVGAVDRNGDLASFSSRGPRPGDLAVKPEITGPGVGIAAPRAGGTAMGTPVDEHYTRASGTSMASPHVAGAAALLAQLHPEWGAEQLKAALVSSALPTSGRHALSRAPAWCRSTEHWSSLSTAPVSSTSAGTTRSRRRLPRSSPPTTSTRPPRTSPST